MANKRMINGEDILLTKIEVENLIEKLQFYHSRLGDL